MYVHMSVCIQCGTNLLHVQAPTAIDIGTVESFLPVRVIDDILEEYLNHSVYMHMYGFRTMAMCRCLCMRVHSSVEFHACVFFFSMAKKLGIIFTPRTWPLLILHVRCIHPKDCFARYIEGTRNNYTCHSF